MYTVVPQFLASPPCYMACYLTWACYNKWLHLNKKSMVLEVVLQVFNLVNQVPDRQRDITVVLGILSVHLEYFQSLVLYFHLDF